MRLNRKNTGFILPSLIMLMVMTMILGAVLYTAVYLTNGIFEEQHKTDQAYYNAQKGVMYAIYIIKNSITTWSQLPNITIVITPPSPPATTDYAVTSTGMSTYGNRTVTLTVTVSSAGAIKSWR